METGDEINFADNSYRMLRFESFVFTCLTYKNVQSMISRARIMKANQISKVCASSHEYPHVEKNQESS